MDEPGSHDGQRTGNVVIRHATLTDLDALVPAYGAAMRDEAVASWMVPDEQRRRHIAETEGFGRYVRKLVEDGALVVAEAGGIAGISVWQRVIDSDTNDEVAKPGDADELTELLLEVYGEYVDRVQHVGMLTTQRHPQGRSYFYLQQMVVVPEHRGRGLGSSMLRYGLGIADAQNLPTYLEASTPRNRMLYVRHGFVDVGTDIELPYDGPRLQPMLRESSSESR